MAKKLSLIFSVLFLDFFSFSAVIAFLPLFFLSTPHSFFSSSFSPNLRYILLGILSTTYPIAQVIAAPLLGHLSDKIGRRGILLYSYIGNTVGYLLCGIGILTTSILYLFLGNFIAGLMGVNLSTTNAIISDVSVNEKRSKFFAVSHLMLGIGFILGPFVAGKIVAFSSHVFDACFYLFLSCAIFSFINFLLIYFFWTPDEDKMISAKPTQIFWKDLFQCGREVKVLLFAEFLIFFGWYFFIKTFQVFLIEGIQCSETQVFNVYSQYGLWFTISQLIFIAWLHRFSKSEKFFHRFITFLALSIFVLSFAKSYWAACLIVPLFTVAYGALTPSLTALVSDYASSHNNGKIMGLHQSIQAFAKIGGPLIAGCVLTLTPLATVLLSPLFILASRAVFALRDRKKIPIP
ncbi:MAG TPA: MFS transporter [Rhabdochlamydiaceae bacterium]|nr:MFS transporter [Rhabdochlamydiaceae bacterium]